MHPKSWTKKQLLEVHFSMAKYSYEQRLEAVLNVTEKRMSPQEAADLLGTAREHVRRWVKRYERFGVEGLLLKTEALLASSNLAC